MKFCVLKHTNWQDIIVHIIVPHNINKITPVLGDINNFMNDFIPCSKSKKAPKIGKRVINFLKLS